MGNEQGKPGLGGRLASAGSGLTAGKLGTLSKSSKKFNPNLVVPPEPTDSADDDSTISQTAKRPMPEPEEVTSLFESFLAEMAFKEAVADQMRKLPVDKKWDLVQQTMSKSTVIEKPASYWATTLDIEAPTQEIFLVLRPVINSNGRKWIQEFVEAQGLRKLMHASYKAHFTYKNDAVLLASIQCLKGLMSNQVGMDYILNDPDAIQEIALLFDADSIDVKRIVLQLLAVLAWLADNAGADSPVVVSFNHYKTVMGVNENRFYPLVHSLRCIRHPGFQVDAIVFINTLINACNLLEDRVLIRQDFLELGYVDIVNELRGDMAAAVGFDADLQLLRTGLDVFESEMANDQRACLWNSLDLSDPVSLFTYEREMARIAGHTHHLVAVLRQLLLIPKDPTLADIAWQNIQGIVRIACTGKNSPTDQDGNPSNKVAKFLTFEQLTTLLLEQQDRIIDSMPVSKETAKRVEETGRKMRMLQTLESEAIGLRGELETAKANIVELQGGADRAKLIEEIASLKALVAELQSQRGPSPAAPLPSAPPPLPPGAPVAPPPPGAPVAPPPPGAPVAPPPPGAPGAPSPRRRTLKPQDFVPPGLKPKPKLSPNMLKNLHWAPIPSTAIQNTIWMKLNDSDSKLDVSMFQESFSKVEKSTTAADASAKKKAIRPEFVKLIDEKRSYNIDLSLARFRITPEEIRDAVFSMNSDLLNQSHLQKLKNCVPTAEEIEAVRSYDGDVAQLGNTEKYFLALSEVPNIEARVDIWLFQQSFDELYGEVARKIGLVKNALRDLEGSESFQQLLRLILAVGNLMNGGTAKGQAYGFKLSTLRQLESVKSNDNSQSLLQVIVQHVNKYNPSIRKFVDEFSGLSEAVRVECDPCLSEIANLSKYMQKIRSQLTAANTTSSTKDRFKIVMSTFLEEKEELVRSLQKQADQLLVDVDRICCAFGEPKGKTKWETLFNTFAEFSEMYLKAEKRLEKVRIEAERALIKEERQAQRQAKRGSLKAALPEEERAGMVDGVFDALKGTAGSKSILEQLKARRAAGSQGMASVPLGGVRNSTDEESDASAVQRSGQPGLPPSMPVGDFRSLLKKRTS